MLEKDIQDYRFRHENKGKGEFLVYIIHKTDGIKHSMYLQNMLEEETKLETEAAIIKKILTDRFGSPFSQYILDKVFE